MRYNHHFSNQFSACRLLKTGRDPHRERDVKIYAIPGEFDVVGITDGVDSWVAPVATGFLEDVRKMLQRIQAGEDVQPTTSPRRRIATAEVETTPTGRRRVPYMPPVHNLQSETTKVLRRVLSS